MSFTSLPNKEPHEPLPTSSRFIPHSDNSIRELEAVADIRLEEVHARNGGTIIPVDGVSFGGEDEKNRPSILKKAPPTLPTQNHAETVVDFFLLAIQGFFGLMFYPTSGGIDDENGVGEMTDDLLSDEEIENLAVFQGDIKEFVELQDGQVAPPKIHRMMNMLINEEHCDWERRCREHLPSATLHNPLIKNLDSFRAKLKAFLGTWNAAVDHCSKNIYLLDDQLTVHRIPTVNQTDGVRGKLGVMSGIHAWDMRVMAPTIGTHFTVGVATEKCKLEAKEGYVSLVGNDEESWGWDLVWGNLSHNGKLIADYPSTIIYQHTPGDTIRLILDCDRSSLSFAVNEMSFGVAFINLPKNEPLFPTVGLVYGNVEVSLVYLGVPPPLRN